MEMKSVWTGSEDQHLLSDGGARNGASPTLRVTTGWRRTKSSLSPNNIKGNRGGVAVGMRGKWVSVGVFVPQI